VTRSSQPQGCHPRTVVSFGQIKSTQELLAGSLPMLKRGASLKTDFRLAEQLGTPPSQMVKLVETELAKRR